MRLRVVREGLKLDATIAALDVTLDAGLLAKLGEMTQQFR